MMGDFTDGLPGPKGPRGFDGFDGTSGRKGGRGGYRETLPVYLYILINVVFLVHFTFYY